MGGKLFLKKKGGGGGCWEQLAGKSALNRDDNNGITISFILVHLGRYRNRKILGITRDDRLLRHVRDHEASYSGNKCFTPVGKIGKC